MVPAPSRAAVAAVLLAWGVALAGPAAAAPTGSPVPGDATLASQSDTVLEQRQELRLTPERPGEFAVELRYRVPESVTGIRVELPAQATVVGTDGFRRESGRTFEWTGSTRTPSVVYRMPANVTRDATGPVAGGGDYVFVDVGEWALVRQPGVSVRWEWTGARRVSLSRSTTTAGPGAVGGAIAFLGEHREVRHAAHGQTFRLVVPAAARLAASPEDVFASLSAASDSLRVGDRDPEVLLVAAPTGSVAWAVRGLQTGDADAWVRDSEPVDSPDSVWLHEYVHTRQAYEPTTATRWTLEGMATYYAALLALEQDRIDFASFRDWLSLGTSERFAGSVLADPSTWRPGTEYYRGALVAGDLDRRIRVASDGSRGLQSVLSAMNAAGDPVTQQALVSQFAAVGGQSVADAADRYTTTDATLETWNSRQHAAAFGPVPSRIEYSLASGDDARRVSGPYRNRSVAGEPVTLVPRETLTFDVVVTNTGGTTGEYAVTFRLDGEAVATRTGRLAPGETTVSFSHEFAEPGRHVVAVGDETFAVSVVEPAAASVSSVAVDRETVTVGEEVAITATVTNDATIPGETTVRLRAGERTVATRLVRLDASSTGRVTATTSFASPGRYRVAAGDAEPVSVVVEPASTTSPGQSAGGFGAVPAALALVLAVVVVRLRR